MKNLKLTRTLFIALSLVLFTVFFSFAYESENLEKIKSNCKLIPIVEKYSPETLDDWKQVIEERKELKKNFTKHYRWKVIDSEQLGRREYVDELKAKVEKGEITQQEAKKRLDEVKSKCKGKRVPKEKMNEIFKLKKDLKKAVNEDDKEQVKAILDELYVRYKESNQRLKAKINK